MTRAAIIVIALMLAAALAFSVVSCRRMKSQLSEKSAMDSVNFIEARRFFIERRQAEEKLREHLKLSDLARQDEFYYYAHRDSVQLAEIRRLKRKYAGINISHASTARLDSLQFALYGPAPDDSVHTIPLDYSRKLTGDALRLPIEQRMATMWESRHDSLASHSGRLIDSYKVDISLLQRDQEDAHRTLDTVMHSVGLMQGQIKHTSLENERLRKGRNRERIIGVILIAIALAL
jgi:hypothetical protein